MFLKHFFVFILLILATNSLSIPRQGCPQVISRSEWGARPPKNTVTIPDQLSYHFVHHSAGNFCYNIEDCKAEVRSIQNYHMDDKGWDDIGYSYLIGGDGNLYEGRGFNIQGAHTQGYNDVGYGTCFMGNFMETIPEAESINIYFDFLQCSVDQGKVVTDYKMYGHRQTKDTLCPGDQLYDLIQTWPHWTEGSPAY